MFVVSPAGVVQTAYANGGSSQFLEKQLVLFFFLFFLIKIHF